MGQQQLLLIVLGVILVGVAVVLGIQYFSVGSEEGAKDELVAHCLTIGANAQQWYKKPVAMGGGGESFTTANGAPVAYAIPENLTYSTSAGKNISGTITAGYQLSSTATDKITIKATPNDATWKTKWYVQCVVEKDKMTTTIEAVGS